MGDDGIDGIRRLLSSKPRPTSLAERRERLDEIGSVDPPAADIRFDPGILRDVPVEWSLAPGSDRSHVMVFFHGGGYSSGSIRSHRGMVGEAGRAAHVRALAVGYRLAPENPFPAALEDAVSVYDALLATGVAPEHIAIAGDSAGGGLTLALMMRLRDSAKPLPACGWLISPWVDLTLTGESLATKADVDPIISQTYLGELAGAYLAGASPTNPLVSPLYADLTGLPPLLIQVGSAETLLDDAVRIASRSGAADVATSLEIWPHMIHAWPLWAARVKDGRKALASAGSFMGARLSNVR
jgi:monoterpene epsilon-lactone hydrolase